MVPNNWHKVLMDINEETADIEALARAFEGFYRSICRARTILEDLKDHRQRRTLGEANALISKIEAAEHYQLVQEKKGFRRLTKAEHRLGQDLVRARLNQAMTETYNDDKKIEWLYLQAQKALMNLLGQLERFSKAMARYPPETEWYVAATSREGRPLMVTLNNAYKENLDLDRLIKLILKVLARTEEDLKAISNHAYV